jgi:hypothetical protein
MSRDFLPVLSSESVMEAIEDMQSDAEKDREALGDSAAAQISHALGTARVNALGDVWRMLSALPRLKVLKSAIDRSE